MQSTAPASESSIRKSRIPNSPWAERTPELVLTQVFQEIQRPTLYTCRRVCRRWRLFADSDPVWRAQLTRIMPALELPAKHLQPLARGGWLTTHTLDQAQSPQSLWGGVIKLWGNAKTLYIALDNTQEIWAWEFQREEWGSIIPVRGSITSMWGNRSSVCYLSMYGIKYTWSMRVNEQSKEDLNTSSQVSCHWPYNDSVCISPLGQTCIKVVKKGRPTHTFEGSDYWFYRLWADRKNVYGVNELGISEYCPGQKTPSRQIWFEKGNITALWGNPQALVGFWYCKLRDDTERKQLMIWDRQTTALLQRIPWEKKGIVWAIWGNQEALYLGDGFGNLSILRPTTLLNPPEHSNREDKN